MSDQAAIDLVKQSFANCARPEGFIVFSDDEESKEHDTLLCSRELDSLRMEDVNNPGWNPFNSISPEGFCYYFPALARLALATPTYEWFMSSLLFQLTYEGQKNKFFQFFSPEQRTAVGNFLKYVARTRSSLLDEYSCNDDMQNALKLWSSMDSRSSRSG